MVKIVFTLKRYIDTADEVWPPYDAESVWASEVQPGEYRIDNIPFYARDIALDDVVRAEFRSDGQLGFRSVVRRGGHSVYRVRAINGLDDHDFIRHLRRLTLFGCGIERGEFDLIAVDVPPSVKLPLVRDILRRGKDEGAWEWEAGSERWPDNNQ